MIVDFTISNIGPFKDPVTLTFEASTDTHLAPAYVRELPLKNGKKIKLLRMALLYGANAAGKTTVLEALSLLDDLVTAPVQDAETELKINTFAFTAPVDEQASELMIKFIRGGVIYRYQLLLTRQGILCETLEYQVTPPNGVRFAKVYQRCRGDVHGTFGFTYGKEHQLNASEQQKLETELLPNTTMLSVLNRKMTIQNEMIKNAYEWFKEQLMGEVSPETDLTDWVTHLLERGALDKNKMLEILNQAGMPIQDLKIAKSSITKQQQEMLKSASSDEVRNTLHEIFSNQKEVHTVYNINQAQYALKLQQESLGTQRYYGLAGLLSGLCAKSDTEQGSCRILPIDEIEHSLHPDLLEHFMVMFLNDTGNSQLIATTHYRELLQDELLFRDDVIWFVDKNDETMSSVLYCLEDIKADVGLRATSSVYNFYKRGRLGATPQLKA